MSDYEFENINPAGPEGYTGETDRTSGEYHYKNGYTQTIYSDARYSPADEDTVPPRYYTPPEKTGSVKKNASARNTGGKVIAACLVCALIGGVCGSAVTNARFAKRLEAVENDSKSISESVEELSAPKISPAVSGTSVASGTASSSDYGRIYSIACQQVVGVTTEVTYTNFFGQKSSSAVTGTGIIVTADGYIITNYHVIEYACEYNYSVSVMLYDGTRYAASVVGADEANDIAVLKIDASGLVPATIGNSSSLSVGCDVSVVGNPLGELNFSMTFGRVSALDRQISTDDGLGAINMFQIDAAVNSGNSGGPVYNSNGEVVGIVTAKYSSTGVEGIGFAIPINDAAKIADDIITNGYVTGKASLGLCCDERYTAMYSQFYGYPMGAYVKYVSSGSCAEKSGLCAGDIIVKLDGNDISGSTELTKAVHHYSAGDSAEIVFYRAGQYYSVNVVFDEASAASQNSSADGYI